MTFDCPHSHFECDGNYHLDMCDMHPEKIWGVEEADCEQCPQCPNKEWQEWRHSLHEARESRI